MRTLNWMVFMSGLLIAAPSARAQGPDDGPDGAPNPDGGDVVSRMLAFDKDKDSVLTKAEVTDQRLLRLFDRADVNKNGAVTKEELSALAARERANERSGPRGFGPGGPMGGPPRPGEILPPNLQQRLNLTAAQKTQLANLQKEVDSRLAKILDDEQNAQLKEMRQRRPGRGGPPGGGPPGGSPPSGRPPDGEGFPPPRERFR